MARRAFVPTLSIGEITLPPASAHHVRNVLRLQPGDTLQLFTQENVSATATMLRSDAAGVLVRVTALDAPPDAALSITVAAALPKGERADWMVEKLCELGVARLIPLAAERSVVLPAGQNKLERWRRIAIEAARQSGRPGVMQVDALTHLPAMLDAQHDNAATLRVHLSTQPTAPPLSTHAAAHPSQSATLFIGPEGGWTPAEIARFSVAAVTAVRLTRTVLRVETAAIVAAALLACRASN